MSAPNDLVSLSDAQSWLGVTSDDNGIIARLISAVSTSIQNYISYDINVTEYTETHNGIGSHRQMLRNRPIVSVTTVTIIVGGAGFMNIPPRVLVPGASGQAGYTFDDRCIYLDAPYRFERGLQNIKIIYDAGYQTVPADLKQACLQWMQSLYYSSASGGGVSANVGEMKAGDHSLKFNNIITQLNSGTIPIPPSILVQIQPYSRVYPA